MKEMTAYAASLTGATGKALDAETITVGPKRLAKLAEEEPSKSDKQDKVPPKSKKDEKEVWRDRLLLNVCEVLTVCRTRILPQTQRRGRRKPLVDFRRRIR